jgi:glycerophosphoryl diester phosphodiesterase
MTFTRRSPVTRPRVACRPLTAVVDNVRTRPLVIGHRGACGYRPEHTLESYRLAIRLGADSIEPDLVPTRDGVLVARHESEISRTTDVASHPEFAGRRTTKVIDGEQLIGWFTEDFTLAELRTLRATERLPGVRPQNTIFDGRYAIPTLQEILDLAADEGRRLDRPIGVSAETKHPSYFASIGLPLEEPLAGALRRNGLDRRTGPVLVQSFEIGHLRTLSRMTDVRLFALLDSAGAPQDLAAAGDSRGYADLATPAGLDFLSGFVAGIGADKDLLVPRGPGGALLPATSVVADAHAAGLLVHAWTFRAENEFLPPEFRIGPAPEARGDIISEYELFLDLGVDGVISDHPDTAVAAVNAVGRRRVPAGVA